MASGNGRVSGLRCEYHPPTTCEARGSRSADARRTITSGIRQSLCGIKNGKHFFTLISGGRREKMVRQGETLCVVARPLPHRVSKSGIGCGLVHSLDVFDRFASHSKISDKFGGKEGGFRRAKWYGNVTGMLRATKQGVVRVDGAVSVVEDGDIISSGDEVSVEEYGPHEESVDGYLEEVSETHRRSNVRLFDWLKLNGAYDKR